MESSLEDMVVGLEAEVTALRKTLSVVLFLLADRGLTSGGDLAAIATIIADDLQSKSAAEEEGSLSGAALAAAGPMVLELVEAALRPLEVANAADSAPNPPWSNRTEMAAMESLLSALIIASLRGKPDAEKRFGLLNKVARNRNRQRPWPGLSEATAQNLRRDSQEEINRILLVIAQVLEISLDAGAPAGKSTP